MGNVEELFSKLGEIGTGKWVVSQGAIFTDVKLENDIIYTVFLFPDGKARIRLPCNYNVEIEGGQLGEQTYRIIKDNADRCNKTEDERLKSETVEVLLETLEFDKTDHCRGY